MLWECVELPKPSAAQAGSAAGAAKRARTTPPEEADEKKMVPLTLPRPSAGAGAERDFDINPAAQSDDVLFFPELPEGPQLRWQWYMRRRRRPMVPAPSGTPMPDKQADGEGKARLFSIYLRPWVLDRRFATQEVPHLADLDLVSRRRLQGKQHMHRAEEPLRSYAQAWRKYVRGRVVSHHAKRLIVQFMAACCGKSKGDRDGLMDVEEEAARTKELPGNDLPLARVHAILDRMSQQEGTSEKAESKDPEEEAPEEEVAEEKALCQSGQIRGSMQVTAKLWARTDKTWPEEPVDGRQSSLGEPVPPASGRRKPRGQRQQKKGVHPKAAQASAYPAWSEEKVAHWWDKVRRSAEPPTAEQEKFLQRIIGRCRTEQQELGTPPKGRSKSGATSEPVRDCLFGVPGAGKSKCIKLLRSFFEECLGWEDGVDFQFLATT